MRKIILLIIFVLFMTTVLADKTQTGKVRFEIINQPPSIAELRLVPEPAYPDMTLACSGSISDEVPSSVRLVYAWYKNGILQDASKNMFSGFTAGDRIVCRITPFDEKGLEGESRQVAATIKEPPRVAALLKGLISIGGKKTTVAEVSQGMGYVTGLATGREKTGSIGLVLIMFLLLMLNLLLILKFRKQASTQIS